MRLLALFALSIAFAYPLFGQNAQPLRTAGPIADGPLQVGTWVPMTVETPPWIFPMVYGFWRVDAEPVEAYADMLIEEIKRRPADQPIWLQTQRWFGRYRPGWDRENVLAFGADATPQGTPGLWPDKGVDYWIGMQRTLLKRLRDAGCRVDGWPLDNETWIHPGSHNFREENTFRNMVTDPRWRTRPLWGLGGAGLGLLDPAELDAEARRIAAGDEEPFTHGRGGTPPDSWQVSDSRLATEMADVIGRFLSSAVFNDAFASVLLEYYPHAWASNYRKYRQRIPYDDERALERLGGARAWKRFREVYPQIEYIPEVGTHSSPPFYGQGWYWITHPEASARRDRLAAMLEEADWIIELHGGDGSRLIPWITLPHFRFANMDDRVLSAEEYETLILELVRKGVRRFIAWNTEVRKEGQEENQREMLAVLQKAYGLAERLDREARQEGERQ